MKRVLHGVVWNSSVIPELADCSLATCSHAQDCVDLVSAISDAHISHDIARDQDASRRRPGRSVRTGAYSNSLAVAPRLVAFSETIRLRGVVVAVGVRSANLQRQVDLRAETGADVFEDLA